MAAGKEAIVETELDPAAIDLGDLERSASFLLRIAQLAAYEAIFAIAPNMPLKLSEQTLLQVIEDNPDARQGAIADVLHIKWSHMTKFVRSMEMRGLVERYVPPNDRRSVLLRLTEEGRAQLREIRPRMRKLDAEAMSMLTAQEHRQLVGLLRKVAGRPPLAEDPPAPARAE
ncbi:MarR family winged helix-turn-helix transcriptional regulator [Nitratireductor thuwali]|uniref:Transcriptional repressor MprA n=1 Tax=Nitratireductor thuwali TaxID=2267699 RepID=A0ABY5MHP3_9HYPH|nr:Transcriptional repressor MprA [Nitratireductor thuwali]